MRNFKKALAGIIFIGLTPVSLTRAAVITEPFEAPETI
jgi:hypothetical protein